MNSSIFDTTICAPASNAGGAVALIRVSGKDAFTVVDAVFRSPRKGKKIAGQAGNSIHFGVIRDHDNQIVDEVLVSIFRSPHSYTGEDAVEISCHGSGYIQQRIIELLLHAGAELARPGEFTQRAFLNGKMDLSQAEAVADLIASSNKASHKIALNQMRGGFKNQMKALRDRLLQFISLIELELDFGEEDVEFADRTQFRNLISEIHTVISRLANSFTLGNVIKNGIPVAIVGEPNAGKSTLLNLLLREEKALVSDIAGTTRDAIEDVISIEGISFRFIDTAGLRETTDTIESMGIERTHQKIEQAEIVLLVIDINKPLDFIDHKIETVRSRLQDESKLILIFNKIDSYPQFEQKLQTISKNLGNLPFVAISAKAKTNFGQLEKQLLSVVEYGKLDEERVIVSNLRHYQSLSKSQLAIERVLDALETGLPTDLLAQDIREVLHYMGEITGEITNDEILGNIFKNFCIGK